MNVGLRRGVCYQVMSSGWEDKKEKRIILYKGYGEKESFSFRLKAERKPYRRVKRHYELNNKTTQERLVFAYAGRADA